MSSFQEVLTAARTLNAVERLRLASTIMEEMPPENWPLPDAEWIAEAQRRSVEFDAGRMSAAVWTDVQIRTRRKAGLDE